MFVDCSTEKVTFTTLPNCLDYQTIIGSLGTEVFLGVRNSIFQVVIITLVINRVVLRVEINVVENVDNLTKIFNQKVIEIRQVSTSRSDGNENFPSHSIDFLIDSQTINIVVL